MAFTIVLFLFIYISFSTISSTGLLFLFLPSLIKFSLYMNLRILCWEGLILKILNSQVRDFRSLINEFKFIFY